MRSVGRLANFVLTAFGRETNWIDEQRRSIFSQEGEFARIGILDSVYQPPESRQLLVNRIRDYTEANEDVTTQHGVQVTDLASAVAPEAQYNFYRIVDQDGVFSVSRFIKALGDAVDHDLDVLNLSLGLEHADCGGACRSCIVAERVADSGVLITAAAGNHPEDRRVVCPARAESVLSVGTSEVICPARTSEETNSIRCGHLGTHTPGSYWIDPPPELLESVPTPELYGGRAFCSHGGCSVSQECDTTGRERCSDFTVADISNVDILSPGRYPEKRSSGVHLCAGTSYSAAFVAGVATAIRAELAVRGVTLDPQQLIRSLTTQGDELDCGVPRVNARASLEQLVTRYSA